MTNSETSGPISALEHSETMAAYIRQGEQRAHALSNRGPIKLDGSGNLDAAILEAYWRHGFYVFENVIGEEELAELRADVARVLAGAPTAPDGGYDAQGNPAIGGEFALPPYGWAKPLSDPLGGTSKNKGRHPVKMQDPTPPADGPDWTIERLRGNLQLMESCVRLYGHPGLLAVAAAVNGDDFVPYNEVVFIKEPGLGPSVAWHQDGTTHWDAPDWDQGAHGFNFMAQLYPSTAGNGVWVLPGSHKLGKVDIKKLVADSGSERIEGAVPLLCQAGDVFITNRQAVHGSFANSSPDRRVTLNEGFFPRNRVLDVSTSKLDGTAVSYDAEQIQERSRLIAVATDARRQRFPDEAQYRYRPLIGQEDDNRWNAETRETLVKDYNIKDFYI
ncbi:MAG: phytanoyl-CoA dioxygenase [Rhodospirillaceae bacterium]|jgi:hypothetical protein|nr:phytanoyl-CoA dioxygenase [Rhodospirillaceae bacterium]MBT4490268.1 phytanoyl-CoA dioxygenase [Rhodospirillaceae bacterium]MBT5195435.1 phytanoyl-CoA dioxygenase [Rhodospirillaceae bacterium]MBT5897778.1 phytanoyl-CoA dioxygenase [Rhodospirillaceae bacterium]MBT6430734.1 phytanoyl-CoA dioxygenase [Rhodospirillaceae bacterium]